MFETILNFLVTVPVESTVLRSVIMVAEILAAGFVLYYLWEMVPRLSRGVSKAATNISKAGIVHASARPKHKKVSKNTAIEEETSTSANVSDFKDLFTDLIP